ncbi:hypothetical protein [Comamonas thiooxydans]|uniref:hypothetical protein n=1 Tax=Comamonas thiooxydans TaxID=363952 RepID=UPI00209C5208|nr:hypothetical protein [Comamonas thiooxydans]MCO8251804.1 hypothetical protein [Comamonas thiooxydans]
MGKVYGNSTTVSYGTNGTPLATSSAGLGTPHTYGGVGVDVAEPAVKGKVTVPLGSTGKSVEVVAKSAIPRANVAKGLIKLAKIGRVTPGGLLAGLAIEAMIDLGLKNVKLGPDGSLTADGEQEDAAFVSDGRVWQYGDKPFNSKEQACAYGLSTIGPAWIVVNLKMTNIYSDVVACDYTLKIGEGYDPFTRNINIFSPSYSNCLPGYYVWNNSCTKDKPTKAMQENEILDKLASSSGWPSSAARALGQMLGEPDIRTDLAPQPAGIVGPMTVPGATSKSTESVRLVPGTNVEAPPGATQTDPGTKTTTSTKTHPITYSGPEVKYGTVTNNVTNITNNVTNVTTTETTKTEEAEDDNKGDQCEKYPDSIACQKVELDTPDDEIPRSKATVTYSIEDSWGGGSCPADVYTNVGGQSIKAYDWQQTCGYVATYVRPILYLLCAFGALWIVMPGKADA